MDGEIDRDMDGWTDREIGMDGQRWLDGWIERWMDGWTDREIEMDGWTDREMDG